MNLENDGMNQYENNSKSIFIINVSCSQWGHSSILWIKSN
jgi:hypothetical protein